MGLDAGRDAGSRPARRPLRQRVPHASDPAAEPAGPFTFMVVGDYGTGIRRSTPKRRQREIAEAMQRTFDQHDVRLIVTAGDNIYAGNRILGLPVGAQGDEDDDWFFTFFQPTCSTVCRSIPASATTTPTKARTATTGSSSSTTCTCASASPATKRRAARRSIPDCSTVSAIAATSSSSVSTRPRRASSAASVCSSIRSTGRIEQTFEPAPGVRWRLPFCHHPPFCAGPRHHNTDRMERLVPLFSRGGVRAVFSGHEHNFQHASARRDRLLRHRRGSKVRQGRARRPAGAHTQSWADEAHFLLVTVAGKHDDGPRDCELAADEVRDLDRVTADGRRVAGPIVVTI